MSDIKESFLNKVDELREERLDEVSQEKVNRYAAKAAPQMFGSDGSDQKTQTKRRKGMNLAIRKSRGTAKVPTPREI